MRRVLRVFFYALAGMSSLLFLVTLAWVIDLRMSRDRVVRNVTLGGVEVGGFERPRLAAVVDATTRRYETANVHVRAPKGGFVTDAPSIGLRVSGPETVRAALAVGRRGPPTARLVGWIASFVDRRTAPVEVIVDATAVYQAVADKDPGPRDDPVEPSVVFEKGEFVAKPGEPGRGIDPRDVIEALPKAARAGKTVIVEVERGEVEPRWPIAQAEALAKEAAARAARAVGVQAGEDAATIPIGTIRRWLASKATSDGLVLAIDDKVAPVELEKLLPDAGEPPVEARFTVDDGRVILHAGRDGTRCCAPEAILAVEDVVLGKATGPARLRLRPAPPDLTTSEAERLRVAEPVGSFETRYQAGQPRVSNIHRIADLVRGAVIEPGETFSVNGHVGRRTAAKGFVSAPIIEEGRFSEGVGGGVSQFATTLFNAAFLAGLDLPEYQSHSIYISRYPYGREATLNYPKPDLRIRNSSPYGVLIWPTYTGTTVTVTLWSTKYVEAAQTGQTRAQRGNCTRVTTERTRTYLADGRREVDHVSATYRPAEGVNC